jgi:hypothetical protein
MEPNEKPKFNWQRLLITIGIVLVTAGVVGGTTWYLLDKSAKDIKTANDKSISELQKQIDELKASKNSSTTSTETTPSTTSNILKVTELGLQFTLPTTLSDAYYVIDNTGGFTVADFTTRTLVTKGGQDCAGGASKPVSGPLGTINLSSTPPPNGIGDITTGEYIKMIGNKYLYYRSAQSACSPTLSNADAEAQNGNMLRAALQTATVIQ